MKNKVQLMAALLLLGATAANAQVNVGATAAPTGNTMLQVTTNGAKTGVAVGYAVTAPTDGAIILGNVGIGTNAPAAQLQFGNLAANRKIVLYDLFGGNNHQFYGMGINGGIFRFQTDALASDFVYYAASSATTSNEIMRIKGNGNVGIGTATPTEALDVVGDIKFSGALLSNNLPGTAGQFLTSAGAAAPTWTTPTAASTPNIYSTNGTLSGFRTLNMTTTNFLRFFNTTDNGFTDFSGNFLQISEVSGLKNIKLEANNTTSKNNILSRGYSLNVGTDAGNATELNLLTGGTIQATVAVNGNVGIATTTPNAKLDVRGNALFTNTDAAGLAQLNSGSITSNVTHIYAATAATTAIEVPVTSLRVGRPGTASARWSPAADFQIGTYAVSSGAAPAAATKLNIRLGNGNTPVPEVDVMTLQGDGKVGIGTIAPTATLNVQNVSSTMANAANINDALRIGASATQYLAMGFDATANAAYIAAVQAGSSARNIFLQPAISGGNPVNVSIGYNGVQPANKLEVVGGLVVGANNTYLGTALAANGGAIFQGSVGIGSPIAPTTSPFQVVGLPVHADNAAATTAGLAVGAFYRTATGVLMVRF